MIVVADTSVVLNLCRVGQADLLQQLFGNVLVPTEVVSEFIRLSGADARFSGLVFPAWIEQRPAPALPAQVAAANLDVGESAAIALCLAEDADLLLLDESLGRAVAEKLGIRFIGLLGILIQARSRKLLPAISPILDRLEVEAGFWIAPKLRASVLKIAGEA